MATSATAVSAIPLSDRRVNAFGPDDLMLFALNPASGSASRVGAIIWGFGVAEVKTARRLAKEGIPCMQVRFRGKEEDDPEQRGMRSYGVPSCKLAMDKLGSELGVSSFILMGNCAFANLSLNAAIADPRVVGLILTNPHIPVQRAAGAIFRHKLAKRSTWSRLIAGDVSLLGSLGFFRIAAGSWFSRAAKAWSRMFSAPAPATRSDVELPERLDDELAKLSARQVKVLVTGATGDSIFRRFAITYGKALGKVGAEGNVTFERLDTNFHIFSRDDDASSLLADTVTRWVRSTVFRCR